jgi:hypothetical protein
MNPPQSRRQSALTHPIKSTWRSRPTFIETKCACAAPKHAESSAQVLLCCNVDEFPNSGRLDCETCAHALICLLLHTPDNVILSHVGPLHTNVGAWVLVSTCEPQRWVAEAVGCAKYRSSPARRAWLLHVVLAFGARGFHQVTWGCRMISVWAGLRRDESLAELVVPKLICR